MAKNLAENIRRADMAGFVLFYEKIKGGISMSQYEVKFNEIASHLNLTDNVAKGNMFGAKCLKINKKAFAMFHQEDRCSNYLQLIA